jgi:hypothetical protein
MPGGEEHGRTGEFTAGLNPTGGAGRYELHTMYTISFWTEASGVVALLGRWRSDVHVPPYLSIYEVAPQDSTLKLGVVTWVCLFKPLAPTSVGMLLTTLARVALSAHAVRAATNAIGSQICPAGCKCVGSTPPPPPAP